MKSSYLPGKDSELYSFQGNFRSKLPLHASELGLEPAEVTDILGIIDSNRNSYDAMISKRSDAKSSAAEYKISKKAAVKELRRISKLIKASKKYTETIGEDLNIIGPEIVGITPSDKKPLLKLKVNGHVVGIRFNKGDSTGINIYSRRGAEKEFTFLVMNTEVPYLDKRDKLDPLNPELREYYAFFIEKNTEVGLQSDVVKVIVP